MDRVYFQCKNGHFFSVEKEMEGAVACPKCGDEVAKRVDEKDSPGKKNLDKLVDATFDVMGEGGTPTSGAR